MSRGRSPYIIFFYDERNKRNCLKVSNKKKVNERERETHKQFHDFVIFICRVRDRENEIYKYKYKNLIALL